MKHIFLALILIFNFSPASLSAGKTPEEKAAEKAAKAEKKRLKELEKQQRKEEKERLKAEKKKKKEEEKKKRHEEAAKKAAELKLLKTYTKEDQAKLDRIMKKFIGFIGKDAQDYKYKIISNSSFNAYATLGRKIRIHSSLFHKLKTEAGLATIIAHELGHVERKHVVKGMATSVATSAAGTALGILTGSGAAVDIFNGVSGTARKAYSRGHERSADLFAIDLMNKLYCQTPGKLEGYDEMLALAKKSKYRQLEYQRTHPLTEKRLQYMKTMIIDAGCVL